MAKIIEAKAILSAKDETGAAFRSIAKRMSDASKASAAFTRGGGAQVSALAKQFDGLNAKVNQAVAFREASKQLGAYRIDMVRAGQEAARLKSALDAVTSPTRTMQRDFERASKAADAARTAFMSHGQATRQMRQGLEAAGVPINRLAGAQADLERRIKATSAAMTRQAALQTNPSAHKPPQPHHTPTQFQHLPVTRDVPIAGGFGVIAGVQAVIAAARAGMDIDTERSQARQAGWKEDEIKRAEGEANRYSAEYGVAPGSALNIIREARPTFGGDLDQTLANVPNFFKVLTAMRQKTPGASDADQNHGLGEIIKAGEILGYSSDPVKLREYADFMTKMTQVHGSALRPGEVLNFAKRAKSAGSSVDMDFLKSTFPTMLPEIGGDGLGTANMTLRQALVGGKMKKRAAENLAELGLIDPSGFIQTDDKDVKGVKANAILGRDLAERNPLAWAEKYLIPAMDAKGYTTEQRSGLISTLYSDRNAEHMVNMMVTQRERLAKDRAVVEKAQGLDGVKQALIDDPYLAGKRVAGGLSNAGAALSTPFMEMLKAAADAAANTLNATAEKARENPGGSTAGTIAGAAGGSAGAWWLAQSSKMIWRGVGAATGGVAGGFAGGMGGAILADYLSRTANGVGSLAGGRTFIPQNSEQAEDLKARIRDLDERLDQIRERTHPSRRGEFNSSNDRLSRERQELVNRLDLSGLKATIDQPIPVGPVKLEGSGTVSVTVKVQGGGQVTGMSSTSSGHIKVDVGTSMAEFDTP